jgi:hypothetical protein
MRKGLWILGTLAVVALALPLVLIAQAGAAKQVSPFGFMVENAGVRMVVDTETARYQGKSKYIPLVVFIGYNGTQSITLTRGAFTLTDPSGKVVSMADRDTIKDKKNYGDFNVANDYTFIHKTIEVGPDVQSFNGLTFQQGAVVFFPNVSGLPAMIREPGELRPFAFTSALMYFANPGGKMKGAYKLTYTDPATKGTVTVPFEIEWK